MCAARDAVAHAMMTMMHDRTGDEKDDDDDDDDDDREQCVPFPA